MLALGQLAVAAAINRGEVDENVSTSVVGADEAETFGPVEPLDSTCSHFYFYLPFLIHVPTIARKPGRLPAQTSPHVPEAAYGQR